ncbi:MAG: T9SS type A sorting domain-containing protein, partial [Bacteroidota bacterium]
GTWEALIDQANLISGTNNEIRSLAQDENGNLYVGGNFLQAGGNFASSIARWDGNSWQGLGDGTSGFVQAIQIDQNYIYAGGNFALAGGNTVNRIARWNRQSETWETLGNGLSSNVNTLTLLNDTIYVGGSFVNAFPDANQSFKVNNIARWSQDGGWEGLGSGNMVGSNGPVNALLLENGTRRIFAGRNYTQIGRNQNVSDLAFWEAARLTSLLAFPENSLKVFPNPAQELIFIKFENLPVNELEIRLFDQQGKLLFRDYYVGQREKGTLEIPLRNLLAGHLILKIQGGNYQESISVMHQR